MFSGIQSPYLGIVILIVISIGVTLLLTKYSYQKFSISTRNNILPVLFVASFTVYGLFFSLITLFKAEPENIEEIGADIFQVNIGLALIILGCGLAILFATAETQFMQDDISKILMCASGILAIIGFIIILNTGLVFQKILAPP